MPSTRFPSKEIRSDSLQDRAAKDAFRITSKILEDMHQSINEAIKNRILHFDDDFGGIGNGIADNSNAFIALSEVIQRVGACTVMFGTGKVYLCSWGNNTLDRLIDLSNTDGVTILGNGATIVSTITPASTAGNRTLMLAPNVLNLTVDNFHLIGSNAPLAANTPLDPNNVTGEVFLAYVGVANAARNIAVYNCTVKRALTGPVCLGRGPADIVNSGVTLIGGYFEEVWYPFGAYSTNDIYGRYTTYHCGRSFFLNNPANRVDVVYESTSAFADADCIIGLQPDSANDEAFNTLSGIKIKVISKGRKEGIGNQGSGHIYLDLIQKNGGDAAGIVRGMDLEFQLDGLNAATAKFSRPVEIVKRLYDGTADTTIRGHILRDIRIHGTAVNWQNALDGISLFNTGTWASGGSSETIEDLRLEDITIDGNSTGANHISLNAEAFSAARQSCTIKNVNTSKAISITNDTGKCIGIHSTKASNKNATDIKATSYTPVCTATGGGFALNDGTITGRWARFGEYADCQIKMVIGAATVLGAGFYLFTLPVQAENDVVDHIGSAQLIDTGVAYYPGICRVSPDATAMFAIFGYPAAAIFGPAYPIALAAGDTVDLTIRYKAKP